MNYETRLILTMLVIGVLIGLIGLFWWIVPYSNQYKNIGNIDGMISADEKRWITMCSIPYYVTEYVDEIIITDCYAIKRESPNDYEAYQINKSLEYAGMSIRSIWHTLNPEVGCMEINSLNGYNQLPVYCLKDNSTCLELEEDRKICHVVTLK